MIDSRIISVETDFDSMRVSETTLSQIPKVRSLILAITESRWREAIAEADTTWNAVDEIYEKAFVLQWAVAACEMLGDLTERSQWIARWEGIPFASDPYALYLKTFHDGLTVFHAGLLREAEGRFRRASELARESGYARGQMRCLFHLGLIYKEMGQTGKAHELFRQSLALARSRQAVLYIPRIEAQLKTPEIEELILMRDFRRAREKLIEAEVERRKQGLSRRQKSHYGYFAVIASGLKPDSEQASLRCLRRVRDPIVRIRAFELKKNAIGLSPGERSESAYLKELHGVSKPIVQSSHRPGAVVVCGVAVSDIRDSGVRALMRLLLRSEEPVDKTTICREVWSIDYDPVLHDSKIYKLFHRARAVFGRSDLFLNNYGSYRLDPEHLREARKIS